MIPLFFLDSSMFSLICADGSISLGVVLATTYLKKTIPDTTSESLLWLLLVAISILLLCPHYLMLVII